MNDDFVNLDLKKKHIVGKKRKGEKKHIRPTVAVFAHGQPHNLNVIFRLTVCGIV